MYLVMVLDLKVRQVYLSTSTILVIHVLEIIRTYNYFLFILSIIFPVRGLIRVRSQVRMPLLPPRMHFPKIRGHYSLCRVACTQPMATWKSEIQNYHSNQYCIAQTPCKEVYIIKGFICLCMRGSNSLLDHIDFSGTFDRY